MGVVNVTPDSFYDGGRFFSPARAIAHGRRLVDEGADILDVGAESSRPGALPLDPAEEMTRLLPVIEALVTLGVPISVDTRHPSVMVACLSLGVDMVNDITGFADPASVLALARSQAAACVMHMRGEPQNMQHTPDYRDVVSDVFGFLYRQAAALEVAGVRRDRVTLDPGIGFGKTQDQNIALIRAIGQLRVAGWPVLIGLSRKSLIGSLTGQPVGERLAGSLGGALAAVLNGAAIVRVHDVAATRDALTVMLALANR